MPRRAASVTRRAVRLFRTRLGGASDPDEARGAASFVQSETDWRDGMTLVWFVVWLIWNLVGDEEPIVFNPVNVWAGALLLAIALDLARQHAQVPRGDRERHA